jgi:hypothetical protein
MEMYWPQIKQDRKLIAKYYYKIAHLAYILGRTGQGRSYYLKSLKAYPMDIVVITGFLASFLGLKIYTVLATLYQRRRSLLYKIHMAHLAGAENN